MKSVRSYVLTFIITIIFIYANNIYSSSIFIDDESIKEIISQDIKTHNIDPGCIEGSGVAIKEKRIVPAFDSLSIDGAFDVHIVLQKEKDLQVVSDDNIVPKIITEVKNRTLYISASESICAKSALRLNVSARDLNKIMSDGANNIYVYGMNNEQFALKMEGASDIYVSGSTDKLSADISGSGSLQAKKLVAREVKVDVMGSGDAIVYASDKIAARVDGAGDIGYYGKPGNVDTKISGSGEIEQR